MSRVDTSANDALTVNETVWHGTHTYELCAACEAIEFCSSLHGIHCMAAIVNSVCRNLGIGTSDI